MSKPSPAKEVRVDAKFYEQFQAQFLERLVVGIKEQLEFAKVTPEQLDSATKGIAFEIANLIDGTSRISLGEKSVRPVLTFAEDNSGQKLVAPEDRSGMHAHTYKISESLLKSAKTEKDSPKQ